MSYCVHVPMPFKCRKALGLCVLFQYNAACFTKYNICTQFHPLALITILLNSPGIDKGFMVSWGSFRYNGTESI